MGSNLFIRFSLGFLIAVLLVVGCDLLTGCTPFRLEKVKYRVGGRYGEQRRADSATWIDKGYVRRADHWELNAGAEFTWEREN